MTADRAAIYGAIADKRDRDPVVEYQGRATVPMGRGFGLWQRMNPGADLVWITDADGVPRALTPKQLAVYTLASEMVDGPMHTMRDMAALLHVAPSTVSRALAKLQAWGLIAIVVGRGRFGGLVVIRRVRGDTLDRFRDAARARVRRWSEAAQRRFSRLAVNVAPYFLGGVEGLVEYQKGYTPISSSKGATLTTQLVWTAEELAGIV